jgi:hypothetical protein
LQARRESGEAVILKQHTRSGVLVPEQYNDGDVSGSHLERHALQRLLSHSLLDFVRLMEWFNRTGVSFSGID